jgi:hypothetical protein
MSTGETHRNLGDIVRAATLEGAKPGVPVIIPWRMDANQDRPHQGLDECGCAFCPGDDGRETT